MFHRILVGIDGSPDAMKALHAAIVLARTTTGRIRALAVCEPVVVGSKSTEAEEEVTGAERAHLEESLSEARRIAADQGGIEITTELRTGNVAQEIIRVAREGWFDLIALGAHGQRPTDEFLLGTTSDRVARHAPCSVLIVR
ncbi:MAG: universal stress protein [Chloroflexi bacterium]|nr:universal stress protein [Chloroflexota bacterium]